MSSTCYKTPIPPFLCSVVWSYNAAKSVEENEDDDDAYHVTQAVDGRIIVRSIIQCRYVTYVATTAREQNYYTI